MSGRGGTHSDGDGVAGGAGEVGGASAATDVSENSSNEPRSKFEIAPATAKLDSSNELTPLTAEAFCSADVFGSRKMVAICAIDSLNNAAEDALVCINCL